MRADVRHVVIEHAGGERALNQRDDAGVAIRVADAGVAARVGLDDHECGRVPGQRAVGLRRVGRNAVRACAQRGHWRL
jgi:hypothetical protein